LRTERVTLYISKELNDLLDSLVNESVIGEKKNTIILRCLLAGLKSEYKKDFEKKK